MTTPDNARCQYQTWYVYRLYAASGLLLYIGKTYSTKDRFSQHAVTQPWWDQVCIELTRVETYATETSALAAERYAIRTEHPKFNKQHNQTFRLPIAVRHEIKEPAKSVGIFLAPPPVDFYDIIADCHHRGQKLRHVIAFLRQDYPRYTPEIEASAQCYREWLGSRSIAAREAAKERRRAAERYEVPWQKYMRDISGQIGRGADLVDAVRHVIEKTGDKEGVRQVCEHLLGRKIGTKKEVA